MKIVYYVLFVITLIYALYYVLTGIRSFFKVKKIKNSEPKNRFAVLIAARNEANVITDLINSLKNQDYPKDLFDIYVLPNNCTDNSLEILEKIDGIKIIEQKKSIIKSKADALRKMFSYLKKDNYDAYLIFDADNIVHPNFIKRMNDAINSGYSVAQGFRDSKNISDNWITKSYTLYYYMQNFFFNKSRMGYNSSASINGTGFMIKKSVIEKLGFPTVSLTEDLEFTAICAINNIKIAYVSDAITYDEHPTKFMDSWKQRKRWSSGILECRKLYTTKLIKSFFKHHNMASIDIMLNFQAPIIQILGLISTILLMTFKLSGVVLTDIFSYMFNYPLLFTVVLFLLTCVTCVFILIHYNKTLKKMTSGILLYSIFILTWIPINVICLFRKVETWDEIKHDRSVDINNLIN